MVSVPDSLFRDKRVHQGTKEEHGVTDDLFLLWQGQKDLNLLHKPPCGSRNGCRRAVSAAAATHPPLFPPLAALRCVARHAVLEAGEIFECSHTLQYRSKPCRTTFPAACVCSTEKDKIGLYNSFATVTDIYHKIIISRSLQAIKSSYPCPVLKVIKYPDGLSLFSVTHQKSIHRLDYRRKCP